MGGIKLQLLCGVRIELAVGALPYLARIPVQVPPRALWGYSKYLPLRAKKSLTFFECDARNGWGARN